MKRNDAPHSTITAVDLEVVRASLSGIVHEMQNALFRTGFSTIIRESQDASCALLDAQGDVIAQHVVLPLHLGAFPACCAAILRTYGSDLAEGDAFLINHPYEGGSPHAPDMAVFTAVFHAGRHVGFCASMAHKGDIGGPVPGSCSGQARETFNEGLHLPGRPLSAPFRAMRRCRAHHCRQLAHARVGAGRYSRPARARIGWARDELRSLFPRLGFETLLAATTELLRLSEAKIACRDLRVAGRSL